MGIPLDVLPKRGPTARQVERMERINDSDLPQVSTRPRCREESTDERKLRKQAIKEERKVIYCICGFTSAWLFLPSIEMFKSRIKSLDGNVIAMCI